MKKPSAIVLPEIKAEGLIFEVKAEIDFCDKPLIFVNIRMKEPMLHTTIVFSGKGLSKVSKGLLAASKDIENAYSRYWAAKK